MDKIEKFLLKLNKKEREVFQKIFNDLIIFNLKNYDIKALKGLPGLFRLRKGKIRIIFFKDQSKGYIVDVNYRGNIY